MPSALGKYYIGPKNWPETIDLKLSLLEWQA